jgi:hypothetical protein
MKGIYLQVGGVFVWECAPPFVLRFGATRDFAALADWTKEISSRASTFSSVGKIRRPTQLRQSFRRAAALERSAEESEESRASARRVGGSVPGAPQTAQDEGQDHLTHRGGLHARV